VTVVNEVFAKKYFGSENPLGRRIGLGGDAAKFDEFEIVGVAKTARYNSLKQDIPPIAYLPYTQNLRVLNQVVFELRTATDPLGFVGAVRQIVHEVGPRVPVYNVITQSAQIDQTIGQERTFAQLCTCFAGLALVIASMGLYGTMAYAVARRTNEIGVRMALGAATGDVIRMVLRDSLWMVGTGMLIGLPCAYAIGKVMETALFGLSPLDPRTTALSFFALLATALLAAWLPARRAARIDPMTALREE